MTEAQRISTALLEAAEFRRGAFPNYSATLSREQFSAPVPFPTACSPQAWGTTTPIMLVTTLMPHDPNVSSGGLYLDPVLRESYGNLHLTNAPIGASRITMDISGSAVSVPGLPEGMTFQRGYRTWVGDLMEEAGPQPENYDVTPRLLSSPSSLGRATRRTLAHIRPRYCSWLSRRFQPRGGRLRPCLLLFGLMTLGLSVSAALPSLP